MGFIDVLTFWKIHLFSRLKDLFILIHNSAVWERVINIHSKRLGLLALLMCALWIHFMSWLRHTNPSRSWLEWVGNFYLFLLSNRERERVKSIFFCRHFLHFLLNEWIIKCKRRVFVCLLIEVSSTNRYGLRRLQHKITNNSVNRCQWQRWIF